jgi:choline-sulfatase
MQGKHEDWQDEAFSEYLAHGVARPTAMLRKGRYKLHYSLGDPPQLYDIPNDPNEFPDLSREPVYQSVVKELQTQLLSHWDPVAVEQQVRQSQVERQLIQQAYQV